MVPGDIVQLSAGDLIPADGRVLEAHDFFVKQALLTGESYPVEKRSGVLPDTATDLQEATNAVFMGTAVISGSARMRVIKTGADTAIGEIADSISSQSVPTSFELGTRRFGMLIMRLTVLMVMFVLLVNAFFHKPWLDSFLFAVALAVGLTPELLPMVISVTLSRGALRMAKQHMIVKRLSAIQDLGSMDVLCTDKTGTLTAIRGQYHALEEECFRVLGIAWRQVPPDHPHAVVGDEAELVLAGFAAFLDPPKESAAPALEALKARGHVVGYLGDGINDAPPRPSCFWPART